MKNFRVLLQICVIILLSILVIKIITDIINDLEREITTGSLILDLLADIVAVLVVVAISSIPIWFLGKRFYIASYTGTKIENRSLVIQAIIFLFAAIIGLISNIAIVTLPFVTMLLLIIHKTKKQTEF